MAKKEYSCVKRTKNTFINSLAALSKEYPLNKITVKLLCEHSELSRNSFYFHYQDINDLIRDAENQIIKQVTSNFEVFEEMGFPDNVYSTIDSIVNIFDEKRDIVLMLLDKSYSDSFLSRLYKLFSDFNFQYYQHYHRNADREVFDMYYSFLSNGFYGSLRHWLENPGKITKKAYIRITFIMIKRLLVANDPDIEHIAGKN